MTRCTSASEAGLAQCPGDAPGAHAQGRVAFKHDKIGCRAGRPGRSDMVTATGSVGRARAAVACSGRPAGAWGVESGRWGVPGRESRRVDGDWEIWAQFGERRCWQR